MSPELSKTACICKQYYNILHRSAHYVCINRNKLSMSFIFQAYISLFRCHIIRVKITLHACVCVHLYVRLYLLLKFLCDIVNYSQKHGLFSSSFMNVKLLGAKTILVQKRKSRTMCCTRDAVETELLQHITILLHSLRQNLITLLRREIRERICCVFLQGRNIIYY